MQMNGKVTIVDYSMGNLHSVAHACDYVGLENQISSDANEIMNSKAIIIPGVGAFGDAMANLERFDLVKPICDFVQTGRPVLGICLGLQLLFSEGYEFGTWKGLNIIEGEVVSFPKYNQSGKKIRVPMVGWNSISKGNVDWKETPLDGINELESMYFVHSYYVHPKNADVILTKSTYEEIEYCSSIKKQNVVAMQFHPEKSGIKGMQIYKNWSSIVKRERV